MHTLTIALINLLMTWQKTSIPLASKKSFTLFSWPYAARIKNQTASSILSKGDAVEIFLSEEMVLSLGT